jgi:hypothetical protein
MNVMPSRTVPDLGMNDPVLGTLQETKVHDVQNLHVLPMTVKPTSKRQNCGSWPVACNKKTGYYALHVTHNVGVKYEI